MLIQAMRHDANATVLPQTLQCTTHTTEDNNLEKFTSSMQPETLGQKQHGRCTLNVPTIDLQAHDAYNIGLEWTARNSWTKATWPMNFQRFQLLTFKPMMPTTSDLNGQSG